MNATYQNIIKYRKLIFCQIKYSIEIALVIYFHNTHDSICYTGKDKHMFVMGYIT